MLTHSRNNNDDGTLLKQQSMTRLLGTLLLNPRKWAYRNNTDEAFADSGQIVVNLTLLLQ